MNILTIDTTTKLLGVALFQNNKLIKERTKETKNNHATYLMPVIEELFNEVSLTIKDLDGVVVANGPGSYTGTRIGVTTAKTIAWANDIPIYTISSLASLAVYGKDCSTYICSIIDAKRRAVYSGVYKWENGALNTIINEQHIDIESLEKELDKLKGDCIIVSPDFENISDFFSKKYTFLKDVSQKPSHLYLPSEWRSYESAHQVVPNYLRITEAERNLLQKQRGE